MNLPFGMLALGFAGYVVWYGITDPSDGFWGGLRSLISGDPVTKRTSATAASFTDEIAALGGGSSSTGGGLSVPLGPGPGSVSGARAAVIQEAKTWLGVPYRFGGESRSGADCSGFTQSVFKTAAGINLPRTAAQQQTVGRGVSMSEAQPGDLIFFGMPAHHVGIYLGGGSIIHEPHTGAVCRVEKIWSESHTARDVLGAAQAKPRGGRQTAAA